MKVLGFKSIIKKDLAVDYRKVYAGTVVLDIHHSQIEAKLDFSIEHSPLGHIEVAVSLTNHIDYPLVPTLRAIKKYIHDQHNAGSLP